MADNIRPRRSMLYMPGSNARALEKARTLPADALIFDLEDAVAPDAKALARDQVVATLAAGGYGGRELLVRVNGLDTDWAAADFAAVATSGANGVLLPKVDNAAMVQEAELRLAAAGAPEGLALWCMLETPRGVLNVAQVAGASPRLAGFVMGTNDLALELNCRQASDRQPFLTSFGLCILAARAEGLAIIDGVFTDLSDADGFAAECRQGLALGFDGKSLIHPKTIAAANEIYGPSDSDVAWAEKIIAAYDEAQDDGKAVIVVDGRMIEDLHVRLARRLVAMAARIAALTADAAAATTGNRG
ncbi:MAG: CoA ester lyase [Alphaproteobacteria bacterium]|nr:CoA ester lyase [Alphaproteobacteria bacterium]